MSSDCFFPHNSTWDACQSVLLSFQLRKMDMPITNGLIVYSIPGRVFCLYYSNAREREFVTS